MNAFRIQIFDGAIWRTMQGRYKTRKLALGWLSFVRSAWHRFPGRVRSEKNIAKDQILAGELTTAGKMACRSALMMEAGK